MTENKDNRVIEDGNLSIAIFMELVYDKDWKKYGKSGIGGDGKGGFMWYEPSRLGYHTSWDWLIPVVDRISNIACADNDGHSELYIKAGEVMSTHVCVSIETLYVRVVKFIQWHNTQTN